MDLLTGINDHGRRLDRILRKALPECPLPLIHKLLRKRLILIDGKPGFAHSRVPRGAIITIPRIAPPKIKHREQETGKREKGTISNEQLEISNEQDQRTGNREQGTINNEQLAISNEQEQGTGNREKGEGRREKGTINNEQLTISNEPDFSNIELPDRPIPKEREKKEPESELSTKPEDEVSREKDEQVLYEELEKLWGNFDNEELKETNEKLGMRNEESKGREQGTGNRDDELRIDDSDQFYNDLEETDFTNEVTPEELLLTPQTKPKSEKKLKLRFFKPPDVLWQDAGMIAFNKPVGLQVHGFASLERMAQAYLFNKLPPSLSFKPGPLHRLDKPSSGIVIFSTSLEGAYTFSKLIHDQKVKKVYLAIVEGKVKDKLYWTDYLLRDKKKKKTFVLTSEDTKIVDKKNAKISITRVLPLKTAVIKGKPYTLIEAEIDTGRTHQIRAQSSFHGFPLAGDKKYGGSSFKGGFFLHAWKMEFLEYKIEAPLPLEFQRLVDAHFK